MANFTQLSTDLSNISALSDNPNTSDGLTSAQLKTKFDKAGNDIKTYINDTLIGELEASGGAEKIGCTGTYTNVQDHIDAIEAAGSGSIPPDGSLSTAKFAATAFSTDGTLADNSDTKIASQKAVKTYADTKVASTAIDTDGALTANSDSKVASQKATKTYADTKVAKSTFTAAGDMLFSTAVSTPTKLSVNGAYKALITNSANNAPQWADSLQSLMTAAGDIVYASGANTPARLAKGTDNVSVLGMASGIPVWENKFTFATGSGSDTSTSVPNGAYTKSISLGVTPKLLVISINGQPNGYFKTFWVYPTGYQIREGTYDVSGNYRLDINNSSIGVIGTYIYPKYLNTAVSGGQTFNSIALNGTNVDVNITNNTAGSATIYMVWNWFAIY